MKDRNFEHFIGVYPLQKTLRNRLIPVGRTEEFIQERGIISCDEQRARDYNFIKEKIDIFHAELIENVLEKQSNCLDWNGLAEAIAAHKQPKTEDKTALAARVKAEQATMRKAIINLFSMRPDFKLLFKKELISVILPRYFENDQEVQEVLSKFKGFATYFTGFFENRKNVYSVDELPTSIAHRTVHVNFGRYLENISVLRKIEQEYPSALKAAENELKTIFPDFEFKDLFILQNFNKVLSQIGIDRYNGMIGGRTLEGNKKVRGINEHVNLAQHQDKTDGKKQKLKLQLLHKQILSDRTTHSFVYDPLENDYEAFSAICVVSDNLNMSMAEFGNISSLERALELLQHISNYDLNHIFIPAKNLKKLSSQFLGHWSIVGDALDWCVTEEELGPTSGMTKKQAESWRKSGCFSLSDICSALEISGQSLDLGLISMQLGDLKSKANEAYVKVSELAHRFTSGQRRLLQDENATNAIREYLDILLEFLHVLKLFEGSSEEDRDLGFYVDFDQIVHLMSDIVPLYNRVRNYVTQKPYSQEKFKLNFESPTLCDGWDINKESANMATLLRKDDLFYLAIMNPEHRKSFIDAPKATTGEIYQKMIYKFLPGPNKMLPKVFFAASNLDFYNPSDKIMQIYEQGTFKKGNAFSLQDCHMLIDFFKDSIARHPDWSQFGFKFSETSSYKDIAGFYTEVQQQGYKLRFIDIDAFYVDQLVDDGKIYLFQIYNRDFSPHIRNREGASRKNLHTLYLENLFSKENLEDVVLKLNGEAELFYRRGSIENPVVHKTGEKLVNRTYEELDKISGKTIVRRISGKVYLELFKHLNGELAYESLCDEAKELVDKKKVKSRTAAYDIVKDKRYTEDQYFFHVPITINFKAAGSQAFNSKAAASQAFNSKALDYLECNKEVKIIGIDRGERHLLYYTLMDQQGTILEQDSLNSLNGVDYREKLHEREKERDEARKNWKKISKIVDLKEGYLSLVVNKLAKMMVDNNAILVLEDLNFGFKRGRFKVEKQVYQKFEKQLIDKLNYFALKPNDVDVNQAGGVLRGYQLAAPFESFEKLGKQSGFIFYVPAWNTSHIDPTTGFCDLFMRNRELADATNFFSKMESIKYNCDTNYFEFSFDYADYHTRCLSPQTKWTVCSWGDKRWIGTARTTNAGRKYEVDEINVNQELKDIFDNAGISYHDGHDLRSDIAAQETKEFGKKLLKQFKNLLKLRYSTAPSDEEQHDCIISPVMNDTGEFFMSKEGCKNLPENADANGSYNIALKGLQLLREEIEMNEKGLRGIAYPKKPNEAWLRFIQGKEWVE
ncbi:MAG: type V CRISPR-associated protein Cas12a/Cpf1 [Eggerthellaceae bacterium]|nr:type V CRISPR-associated protein Cas12a/Cpf1 [Eggerthellaceae bacterium]